MGLGWLRFTAPSVMKLLRFPEVFARLAEADRRIAALLVTPPLPVATAPRAPDGADVVLRKVRFRYGERWVLDGFGFAAAAGAMTAIVGPSGAGKSTLIHLVARFWDVSEGEVRIGGVDVRQMLPSVLYQHVSVMRQNTMLFEGSILDNIRMARPRASDAEVEDALVAAGLEELLARLPGGRDARVGQSGTRLSGGERQRIGLARTLLRRTPVVLLDEPTAFADSETEAVMLRGIRRLRRDQTVIVAAHRLSTVVEADKIVVLDQGRLVAEGTHAELIRACTAVHHPLEDLRLAGRVTASESVMIARILRAAGPARRLLMTGIVVKVLESALAVVPIGLLYLLVSRVLEGTWTENDLLPFLVVLLVALAGQALAHHMTTRISYRAGFAMLSDLRMRLAEHLRRLPLGVFSDRGVGRPRQRANPRPEDH
jgi:ABC-type multidrug transport system fused ATPase/permease subunit